jgi:hypothetical protein
MEQLQRAGRQLRWLMGGLLVLTPLVFIVICLWQGPLVLLDLPSAAAVDTTRFDVIDGFLLALFVATVPFVYWLALYDLFELAGAYATGEVFSLAASRHLRHVGMLLLIGEAVRILRTALAGPLLAFLGLSDGFVRLELGFGMAGVIAMFLILFARVMVIAAELDEQQRLTI